MDTFRTTDLYLAGALKSATNCNPSVFIREHRCEFSFQIDAIESEDLVDRYFRGQLSLPALRFAESLRTLKALIHQARSGVAR
jgi:hypothetical protein